MQQRWMTAETYIPPEIVSYLTPCSFRREPINQYTGVATMTLFLLNSTGMVSVSGELITGERTTMWVFPVQPITWTMFTCWVGLYPATIPVKKVHAPAIPTQISLPHPMVFIRIHWNTEMVFSSNLRIATHLIRLPRSLARHLYARIQI